MKIPYQDPRILIVDDDEVFAGKWRALFQAPPASWTGTAVVPKFIPVVTRSRREAEEELAEAAKRRQPYDAMLLDLELPNVPKGHYKGTEVGLEILKNVLRHSCAAVVVASNFYHDSTFIREALRIKADEYVAKAEGDEKLYRSVVEAYKKGLERRWDETRRERAEHQHLTLACARVADHMARVVSDGLSVVLTKTNDLAELIKDRYELSFERDPEDPICTALQDLQDAAHAAVSDAAQTRSIWSPGFEEPEVVDVEDVLTEALTRFRLGLAYQRLRWEHRSVDEGRPLQLRSFKHDVNVIIQEMVFNAIEACEEDRAASAEDRLLSTAVVRNRSQRTLDVSVTDPTPPLPEGICRKIERGEPFTADVDRAFGLSLAQRAAHGIGSITITSAKGKKGNTVTLHLPDNCQ